MTVSWLAADWPAPDNVVAGTTFRTGGASGGEFESLNLAAHVGDDDCAVKENRRRFVNDCGLPSEPRWLRQVHGDSVIIASTHRYAAEADAVISREADIVCAVLTADCLPVLLTAVDGSEVAAAHAGWRGLSAGILEKTVAGMKAGPDRILAWLGPAISQAAFEVGSEVRDQFLGGGGGAVDFFVENDRGRWQADLYGLAGQRLKSCGVIRQFGGGQCTYSEADRFFSYRRDGRCGRMASFVFRRNRG